MIVGHLQGIAVIFSSRIVTDGETDADGAYG